MKPITLEQLKALPISKAVAEEIERLGPEGSCNFEVDQNRLRGKVKRPEQNGCVEYTPDYVDLVIQDMTHDGNEPMSNKRMLDNARLYIHYNVFTDEEWNNILLPAINRQIAENDSFVRWMPGYLIRSKEDGRLAIVDHDYAYRFGGRDYTSLCICELDYEGNICNHWAWARYDCYELVDADHVKENIEKMMRYKDKEDEY